MEELISVIMSTYNEEPDWLKASIESILNQTYSNLEFIIILDNPNNVHLNELVYDYQKKDNRIKVIPNKQNVGLVKSLNIALENCTGKYIARMDADDIAQRERLSKENAYLEENNLDFVFSSMIAIDENGNELFDWDNRVFSVEDVKKVMGIWNIAPHPTWFIKSEVYKDLGGYRNIPYCEDYDFSLRALNHGFKIGKVNEKLLLYRMRSSSISKSNNFEQFIFSRKILHLYKKDKLDDYSYVSSLINNLKKQLNTTVEQRKYSEAEDIFQEGVKYIQQGKYPEGISKLFKSIMISRYHFQKLIELIKYRSLSKRMH